MSKLPSPLLYLKLKK